MNDKVNTKLLKVAEHFQIGMNILRGYDRSYINIRYSIYEILDPFFTQEQIAKALHRHPTTIKRAVETNKEKRFKNKSINSIYNQIKEIMEK
jgi:IS30 family transposase